MYLKKGRGARQVKVALIATFAGLVFFCGKLINVPLHRYQCHFGIFQIVDTERQRTLQAGGLGFQLKTHEVNNELKSPFMADCDLVRTITPGGETSVKTRGPRRG